MFDVLPSVTVVPESWENGDVEGPSGGIAVEGGKHGHRVPVVQSMSGLC